MRRTDADGPDVPAGALVAKAETERCRGRYERALELGRRALSRAPTYTSGHLIIGRVLLETGEPSRALEHLGAAVEIDERNALALNLLGDALVLAGLDEEADAMYRRAAEVGGRSDGVALARRLLRLGRSDPAAVDAAEEAHGIVRGGLNADELLGAADLNVQGEFETVTMARICEEQGILDVALQIYDSLKTKHPNASLLAGKIAQLRRRIAEAAEQAKEAARRQAESGGAAGEARRQAESGGAAGEARRQAESDGAAEGGDRPDRDGSKGTGAWTKKRSEN